LRQRPLRPQLKRDPLGRIHPCSIVSDISDLNSLAAAIKPHLKSAGSLIAIEGHPTAGKTVLSKALAAACSGAPIGTDGYVDKGRNTQTYVGHLMLDKLAAVLNQLRRKHPVVFIEGICLRDTLGSLNIAPQAFVYCKHITQAGLWADDPQNYLEKGSPRSDLSWVDQQSVAYHLRARPLENADLVYARRDEWEGSDE